MQKVLQLAGLFIAGIVIFTIVNVGNSANKGDQKASNFAAVRSQIVLGMTEDQVQAVAGAPESSQHTDDTYGTSDYWYYGVLSTDGWQLSFTNGKLDSINQG
jgi:outer membrane protein assembly factor BamE (lipoprotein component of BamABCDE complex)